MNASPTPADLADLVGPGLGDGVRSGSAEVLPVSVPGVTPTTVWLVRNDHLAHPMQAYVGRWPSGELRVLSDDQPAWFELMAKSDPKIDTAATALDYVRRFLEVTRGSSVIVREVSGPEDLHWRPGSADEEERRAVFLAGPEIAGPVAGRVDDGFHVELTLVVDQRIQRNLFDVTPDGRITASFRLLAQDLPLPIIR